MKTPTKTTWRTIPGTPSVLVVDDEETIRFALKDFLVQKGFAVSCASEFTEAQSLLAMRTYEVAIVDLRLTGSQELDGLAILSHIRQRAPHTRTILLSANITCEVGQSATKLGVDAMLQKPAPLGQVADLVSKLIARKSGH